MRYGMEILSNIIFNDLIYNGRDEVIYLSVLKNMVLPAHLGKLKVAAAFKNPRCLIPVYEARLYTFCYSSS